MKLPFPRTMRWMQEERSPLPLPALVLLGLVITGWVVWFSMGRLKVYALSQSARVEVDSLAHVVQPPVPGVIEENHLMLGKAVVKGDVLLVINHTAEKLQKEQEEAKLRGLKLQLETLQHEVQAERDALVAQMQAAGAAVRVAQARGQAARVVSEQAGREDTIIQELRTNALASTLEALKSASEARRQQGEALAASLEASRLAATGQTEVKDRGVRLARLEHQIAGLQAEAELTTASLARLQFEIERRTVRATISGLVADLSPSPAGSTLEAGQKLAVIVPEGANRIVARFLPGEAVGRVRAGQPAVVRLEAFPWTEYGVLEAHVAQVADEPQDGTIRAELTADLTPSLIPVQHGMTGTVEVNLEEVAPYQLLLRAAGQLMAPPVRARPQLQSSPPSAHLP